MGSTANESAYTEIVAPRHRAKNHRVACVEEEVVGGDGEDDGMAVGVGTLSLLLGLCCFDVLTLISLRQSRDLLWSAVHRS